MADLKTGISEVYEPTIASDYFVEAATNKNKLVQSGIAASTPATAEAAMQGGRTVQMPYWDDLSHDTGTADRSKVATDDDTDITPDGITTDYDVAIKMYRTQAWQTSSIVKHAAGSDPLQVFIDKYVSWWMREEQRLLLKILKGIFADSTVAGNLQNDISIADGLNALAANLISSDAIEDSRFLLGDAYDKFTALIMHSTPFKRLRNLDLIDFVPVSQQNPLEGTKPQFQGLDVLVDDSMTVTAGGISGYVYDTFLFGTGAIARESCGHGDDDPPFEIYRDPMKGTGAGSVNVITRWHKILHPRGIKWAGSVTAGNYGPTDAQLEADNWTQVWLTKNIRIANLKSNG